jgi:amicyanin
MSSRLPAVITVIALVLGLSGLAPSAARAATHAVAIADFAFAPATLTITVGDTVTWTNEDAVEHTATSTGGAFDSGLLAQGESFSFTFTAAGTYDYLCTPHPTMTGRIVVLAATATAAPSDPPPGGLPDVAMPTEPANPSGLIGMALLAASVSLAAIRLVAAARRRSA